MSFVDYVLFIVKRRDAGWEFKRNEAGKITAFHPDHGSRIFDSRQEFEDWVAF